jgi:glycerol-3-phosphate dehydrogenase
MGEDVINAAIKQAELPYHKSISRDLKIHGFAEEIDLENHHYWYGSDLLKLREMVKKDPEMGEVISEKLHLLKVQVVFAVREEYARTLEDVLSRRIRALQLDARESILIAPRVAEIVANELGFNKQWESKQLESFISLAEAHLLTPVSSSTPSQSPT